MRRGQESKGGGSISKLKKNKNKEISSLSDQIIAKWKSAVDIEKKRKRGPEDENGNDEKRVKVEDKKVSKKEGMSAGLRRDCISFGWADDCSPFCSRRWIPRTRAKETQILYHRRYRT